MPTANESGEIDAYLAEVRRVPLLSREEQRALARRMASAREAFRTRALALPETAVALVALWRERKAAGHTTAALSAHHFDRTGGDGLAAQVDEALDEVERLLERRPRAASVRRRIGDRLAAAALAFEAIEGAFRAAGPAGISEERRTAAAELAEYEQHRDVFVRHNLRLVVFLARRYRHLGVPLADLVQEGNLGLIRAVEKFDPEREIAFSTYAGWWLQQAMIRAVQRDSRTIRIPSSVFELQSHYRRTEETLRSRRSHEPERSEIAAYLDLAPDEVDRIVALALPATSLGAPVPGHDSIEVGDTLVDEDARDPVAEIAHLQFARELPELLAALDPRERTVVEARFGLHGGDEETLGELGRRLTLSRERVRQIELAALGRMRRANAARRERRLAPVPASL